MKSIIGRHRIRANFYHFVSLLYVLTMALWGLAILSDMLSTWIGFALFAIDYLAQMYDPHPNNPGPWFKRHFHRFLEDEEDAPDITLYSTKQMITAIAIGSCILIILIAVYTEFTSISALMG